MGGWDGSVKQLEEVRGGEIRLPQDRGEGAALDGAVLRDDGNPPVRVTVDSVAALGSHVTEADRFQRARDLAEGQIRECRAHAAPGTWNEVTSGVAWI